MVLRNTVWNTAGLAAEMAAGFLLAPFLYHRLGPETYGLWVVLAALVSFLGLMDMGVRAAAARTLAFHRAKGDAARVGETMATGLALLGGSGAVAFGVMAAAAAGVVGGLDIPPDQAGEARQALVLMGLSVGLTLALCPFDAALWAYQRFDRLNLVNIPVVAVRSGLLVAVAAGGGGVAALAVVTLATVAAGGAAKVVLAARLDPALRPGAARPTRRAARELLGLSVWVLAGTVLQVVRTQAGPLLIARLLGILLVPPFAFANRLAAAPASVLVTLATVYTPVATRAYAEGRRDVLQRLLLTSGKYLFALSLGLTAALVFLGRPLLRLWAGPELADAAVLLGVLAAGECLPNTQWVSVAVLGAAGRYRRMAYLYAAELVVMVALVAALFEPLGVLGMCVAVAVPGFLFRGVGILALASAETGLSAGRYLVGVAGPAVLAAALPAAVLAAAVWAREPATWAELAAYGAGYGVLGVASCLAWFPDARAHPAVARVLRLARRGGRGLGRPVG